MSCRASNAGLNRLLEVMAALRDPETGCPWDIEQTFASIAPYTIEEAYEVADAIEREDWGELKGELGDLLLQVIYYTQMGSEAGLFTFDEVAGVIADKMIARHPHVFGDEEVANSAAQTRAWEDVKAQERAAKAQSNGKEPSLLDNLPLNFPGLTRAVKLQKRMSRVGFDWSDPAPAKAKIEEEIAEFEMALAQGEGSARLEDEMGDILFTVANYARLLNIDPEAALRRCNAKVERRFRAIEDMTNSSLQDLGLEELDALWDEVKRQEKAAGGSR